MSEKLLCFKPITKTKRDFSEIYKKTLKKIKKN